MRYYRNECRSFFLLLTLKRDIGFNESQVIAKEAEEELLYRDMQSDLVQQILRRMSALR